MTNVCPYGIIRTSRKTLALQGVDWFVLILFPSNPQQKTDITREATQLKELARGSFGIPDCEGAYSTLLLMYPGQLQSLQDAAATLEKRIATLFSQFDSTLTSITGISPMLGTVILNEVRNISCFMSADKLAAYAGLNPKVKQSGDMKSIVIHMSKRGSPYLRRAIWMAGAIAAKYDSMFKAYYEKKSAEGSRYMNIIGHVSKKMTAVIFAVMRDNKIYKPVLPAVQSGE